MPDFFTLDKFPLKPNLAFGLYYPEKPNAVFQKVDFLRFFAFISASNHLSLQAQIGKSQTWCINR